MKLTDYKTVWVIDFEYRAPTGETPTPHCLVAREVWSGQRIHWRPEDLAFAPEPPFDTGPDSLIVGYYLPAEYSCFLELCWRRPVNSLDLCTEFKWLKSGIVDHSPRDLIGALTHFDLVQLIPTNKDRFRELAMRGGPYEDFEMDSLVKYCGQDVIATTGLLERMEPHLDLPRALLRGRYAWAVAQMERNGTPIDYELLKELRFKWDDLKADLIGSIDKAGIYKDGSFSEARFSAYLHHHGIAWPRLPGGHLCLDDDTFRQQSRAHNGLIGPYHELRASLSQLKLDNLAVGKDGRNRCMLSPFGASTGRHTPSNAKFIFGPATWIRGLIKPPPDKAIAYIDWKQQELGIAAALSGDRAMMDAYTSGDPYLTFAKMAGAVPADATRQSHPEARAVYKVCMLAVGYGMGAKSLAAQTSTLTIQAQKLLQAHRDAFSTFWAWSDRVQNIGYATGHLVSRFGWHRRVSPMDSAASVRNFPVQANGAEMLRLAIMRMLDNGVTVCAPVHDAVLVEVNLATAQEEVGTAQAAMKWASEQVLPGFSLGTDVRVVASPDRYMDEDRGRVFWEEVMGLLGRGT